MAEKPGLLSSLRCVYPDLQCPLVDCKARHAAWLDHAMGLDMRSEGCPHDGPAFEVSQPLCPFPSYERLPCIAN